MLLGLASFNPSWRRSVPSVRKAVPCLIQGGEKSSEYGVLDQENPNHRRSIVRAVTSRPAGPLPDSLHLPAPRPPELTSPSAGAGVGAATRVRTAAWAILAWVALLCAGLGGAAGITSTHLASKFSANAQHAARQGGSALALRSARRDQAAQAVVAAAVVWQAHRAGHDAQAAPPGPAHAPLPARPFPAQTEAQPAGKPGSSASPPRATERSRAHGSRAPPILT